MTARVPSSIRCTIWRCWSRRAGLWTRRRRWPAGSCRIASPQLRRLLEARLSKHGSREYIQVLRLLETFALEEVTGAVEDALRLGTISFDAVRHSALPHRAPAAAAGPGKLAASAHGQGTHHRRPRDYMTLLSRLTSPAPSDTEAAR